VRLLVDVDGYIRATQTSWYNLRVNGRLNGNGLSITPQIRDDDELKAGLDNYPPLSRKLHQEGDCVVRVTVESNGTPSNVNVTKSTGYAPLDKACLSAVQQAHFVPARQEGKTLAASTDININWRLPSPRMFFVGHAVRAGALAWHRRVRGATSCRNFRLCDNGNSSQERETARKTEHREKVKRPQNSSSSLAFTLRKANKMQSPRLSKKYSAQPGKSPAVSLSTPSAQLKILDSSTFIRAGKMKPPSTIMSSCHTRCVLWNRCKP
jgi:TonB family protein